MQIIEAILKQITTSYFVAGVAILLIFLLIVYLLMIIVISYKKRKEAVGVHLPKIDSYSTEAFSKPEFKEPKKFSVELIDLNEDAPQNSKPKDEKEFLTALSLETGKIIVDNKVNFSMPSIENKDFRQNKIDNKGLDI